MKKLKMVALMISAAMAIQTLPMFSLAASAETDEYRVDFNGIESVSEIHSLVLKNSGNAEIIQENGNGILKVSGDQVMMFRLPQAYEGKVIVEYKFKTEGSAYQSVAGQPEWGSAISSAGARSLRTTLFRKGFLTYGVPSNPGHNKFVLQLDQDTEWHTISYLLNTDTQTGNMYLDKKLVSVHGVTDLGFFNNATDIKELLFNNDSQNVMYFDDIVIKNAPSANGAWNFEDYTDVSEVPDLTLSGTTSIVEDEAGNKILKAEKNSKVYFNFPKTSSEGVKIKFKLKADNPIKADDYDQGDFGSLYNGTTQVTRATLSPKGMAQYAITGQEGVAYGGRRKDNLTNLSSGQFEEIIYDIDFTNQSYTIRVNGVEQSFWGYKKFEMINDQQSVSQLKFEMRDNVVYFDDISVTEYSNKANVWDFEAVSSLEDLPSIKSSGTNEITQDPQNETNNVLKLSGAGEVTFNAPKTTKGRVIVEYDYKTAVAANAPNDQTLFGTVKNGNSQVIRAITFLKGLCLFHGTGNMSIFKFTDNENTWSKVRYVIDFNKNYFECYVNDEPKPHYGGQNAWDFYQSGNQSINNLVFQNPEGQVIYLDNLHITEDMDTPLNPAVTNVTIADGTRNVALDTEYQVTFSKAVNLTNENVTVTADGVQIEATVILSEDGKTATIGFTKEYDKEYTVKLTNVKSTDNGTLAEYTTSFTTEAPYVSVKKSTIADDATGVYKDTVLTFTFNKAVQAVNASVTADGEDVFTIPEISEDGMSAAIPFDMTCETVYVVTLNQVVGVDGSTLENPYQITFKTQNRYEISDITVSNSVSDSQIDVQASIANNGMESGLTYQAYAAIYDQNRKLAAVKKTTGTLAAGKADFVSMTLDKPENYTVNDTVKVFFWDQNQSPLTEATEIPLPQARTYGYDNYINPDVYELTVAFLGGSITEQTGSVGYSDYVVEHFDWNGKTVNRPNRYNNGVGGTTSELGMYRVKKDIVSSNPDIVFIDYAVNDGVMPSTDQAGETMENIIRQLMKLDHQPMIILAHMPTKHAGELTGTVPTFNALAEKYGIGVLNVAQYIADEVQKGTYTWEKDQENTLSGDGIHPNAVGARAYGSYMVEQLKTEPEKYLKKMNEVSTPEYSALGFKAPKLVSHRNGQYSGSWTNTTENIRFNDRVAIAEKAGDSVTYQFTGTAAGLYLMKYETANGIVSYSIDGTDMGTIDDGTMGIAMPQYKRLAANLEYGVHTLTITLNQDGRFGIGYFCED